MMSTPAALPRKAPLGRKGIVLIVVLTAILLALGFKNQIKVMLRSGETITATFSDTEGLSKNKTRVKVAGLEVGIVREIEQREDGTSVVTMKVDEGVLRDLGSSPSARIAPITILGGEFFVGLTPGGSGSYQGTGIPLARTGTPVELDRILEALPADTRKATQGTVKALGDTFDAEGQRAVREIADVAPPVLRGSTAVLTAAQGTSPDSDLQSLVSNLQNAAAVLSERRSDIDGALVGLDRTSAVLGDNGKNLRKTIDQLPATLKRTEQGLDELQETLELLGETSEGLHPTADEAEELVKVLDPFLIEARPVVAKLGPITTDAIPTVRNLIPTVRSARGFLDDLKAPTITRVESPVLDKLAKPWNGEDAGTPEYELSGTGIQADNKYYEEIGYMIINLARASMTQDPQGSLLNFQAGAGPATLSLEEALAGLVPQVTGGTN